MARQKAFEGEAQSTLHPLAIRRNTKTNSIDGDILPAGEAAKPQKAAGDSLIVAACFGKNKIKVDIWEICFTVTAFLVNQLNSDPVPIPFRSRSTAGLD